MLRISLKQFEAFSETAKSTTLNRWASELACLAPDLTQQELLRQIQNAAEEAKRYNFSLEENIRRFAELTITLRPGFMEDIDPFNQLRSLLQDPNEPESVKRQWLETFASGTARKESL